MSGDPDQGELAKATRHHWVGPQDLWRMKRQFQIDFLLRMGLQPDEDLLDLGCGTLRGGIPMIEYLHAGKYVGVDVRAEVLAEALGDPFGAVVGRGLARVGDVQVRVRFGADGFDEHVERHGV